MEASNKKTKEIKTTLTLSLKEVYEIFYCLEHQDHYGLRETENGKVRTRLMDRLRKAEYRINEKNEIITNINLI